VDEYVASKSTVVLNKTPYAGTSGLCATKLTQEKYGIKSVYDLVNGDIAKHFDSNGDGKGELWVGAPGWATTTVEKVKARDYGYGEFFELTTTDEAVALAELSKAVSNNKPYVFYCYGPHHIFGQYDLVQLEEPAYEASKYNVLQPTDDPDWYEKSTAKSAYPPVNIHIAYSKSLESRAPELANLLKNIELTASVVSKWTYSIVVDGKEADETAKAWVKANASTVDKWLGL
jgi:glycine betaine/proline transport system substrate-binding protein